jgi:hypothetical protein
VQHRQAGLLASRLRARAWLDVPALVSLDEEDDAA